METFSLLSANRRVGTDAVAVYSGFVGELTQVGSDTD